MKLGIIQARLGSTRLPGKIFKEINGRKLLALMLDRLEGSTQLDKLIIATSTESLDDPIAAFCSEYGVDCFRGSEEDVLERFYGAAVQFDPKPQVIVRMTSDCPLHHAEVVDFGLSQFSERELDYFSNSNRPPNFLEDGCDIEIFTFEALETARNEARLKSQREHVTPFIKDSGKFKLGFQKFHSGWTHKLSVDGPADFEVIQAIFQHFAPETRFGIGEIVDFIATHPEVKELNSASVINAGYQKSLDNDKFVS